MLNIKTRKEERIEKVLQEILDKNVSVDTFQETAARSLEDAEYDKVNAMLLKYYDDRTKGDFQGDLRRELKLMVNEKVLTKLNSVEDLEKSKEERVNEIGNEENVDKDTLEKASKKLDEKEKQKDEQDQNKEFDLRAELMKQVYIEEFKKYAQLLYRLKEKEAYYRELTIGDEEGTKLVLYEKYLMNLESNYKGYANLNKLGEKTLNDNEEIKEIKEKLAYDVGKKEAYIDDKVNKRLNNVKELYEKRQEIAKKMSEITDDKLLQQNKEEFQKQMDYYQEEYRRLTYEMRVQDPTLDDYQEMIRIEKENKEFATRELGGNSEVGFSSGYSDKQKEIDESMLKKSTEAKAWNMEDKDKAKVKDAVDDLIREASTRINQDIRFDEVEKYLEQAEDMLSINENEDKEAKGIQAKVSNETLDTYMDKKVSRKTDREISEEKKNVKDPSKYESPFSVKSECNNTKVEENDFNKKLELKERLRRVQEKRNQMFGKEKEEDKENIELIRR